MTESQSSSRDGVLVGLARAGDRSAFAELVQRYRPLLVAVCRRLVLDPDLAEEAAQDAILRALLVLDTLRRPEQFGPWLVGIGLNMCRRASCVGVRTRRRRGPGKHW